MKDKVDTADALLTQRTLCTQIIEQGGDYLLVVKDNQPKLKEAIAYLFDNPPWTEQEKEQEYQCHSYTDKGHDRIEKRRLEASTTLNEYLDWPGLQQVMRRTTHRIITKTGEVTKAVTYAITVLPRKKLMLVPLSACGAALRPLKTGCTTCVTSRWGKMLAARIMATSLSHWRSFEISSYHFCGWLDGKASPMPSDITRRI